MGEHSIQAQTVTRECHRGHGDDVGICMSGRPIFSFLLIGVFVIGWPAFLVPPAGASHQGHESHASEETHETIGQGYPIPDAPFQVFFDQGKTTAEGGRLEQLKPMLLSRPSSIPSPSCCNIGPTTRDSMKASRKTCSSTSSLNPMSSIRMGRNLRFWSPDRKTQAG